MKPLTRFVIVILIGAAFQCEDGAKPHEINKLLQHKNKGADQPETPWNEMPCNPEDFIMELSNVTGTVRYYEDLQAYAVVTWVVGTVDSQIIGLLCADYPDLIEKTVDYEGSFYEYHGSYKPPLGGQTIFIVKDFTYQ